VRVREGGEIPERIDHDRTIFASTLGGPDGSTLFLAAAEWRGSSISMRRTRPVLGRSS